MTGSTAGTTAHDVRSIPPHERHARIFALFDSLAPGEGFEIQYDHPPTPLKLQLMAQWPGQLGWDELEQGSERWRVRITRRMAGRSCCGG